MDEPCKNGWTYRDAMWLTRVGLRKCVRWGQDNPQEREILEVVWPIEKHWESLLWCMQQNRLFSSQYQHDMRLRLFVKFF